MAFLDKLFGGGKKAELAKRLKDQTAQAMSEFAAGRHAQAAAVLESALSTLKGLPAPDDAETVRTLRLLGEVLGFLAAGQAQVAVLERALDSQTRLSGADDLAVCELLDELGFALHGHGAWDRARQVLQRAREIRAQKLAVDHPDRGKSAHKLGSLEVDAGRPEAGEPLLRGAVELRMRALGPDADDTLMSLSTLGIALHKLGRHVEALQCAESVLRAHERTYGSEDTRLIGDLDTVGLILRALGDLAGAEQHQRRAVKLSRQSDDPHSRQGLAQSLGNLAGTLSARGDDAGALPLLEEALEIKQGLLPADDPSLGYAHHGLALIHARAGRFDRAEPHARRVAEVWTACFGPEHPQAQQARGLHQQIQADLARAAASTAPGRPERPAGAAGEPCASCGSPVPAEASACPLCGTARS